MSPHGLYFSLPSWIFHERTTIARRYLRFYASLARVARRVSPVTIVTHQSTAQVCDRYFSRIVTNRKICVLAAPDRLAFSGWVRDPFVFRTFRCAKPHAVVSTSFSRGSDPRLAIHVLKRLRVSCRHTELPLSGGNVISTSSHHFVGMDHALSAMAQNDWKFSDFALVQRAYEQLLGTNRKVVFVGSSTPIPAETRLPCKELGSGWGHVVFRGNSEWTTQPIFHIDMFLTAIEPKFGSPPVLLVGDPALAREICQIPQYPCEGIDLQAAFDEIAMHLSAQNFRVVRIPLPLLKSFNQSLRNINWSFASYNNVILCGGASKRTALLPSYASSQYPQLNSIDRYVARVFEGLDMQVRFVPGASLLPRSLGGLRCLANQID